MKKTIFHFVLLSTCTNFALMKELIDILHSENLTLVLKNADGNIHRFVQRGVKDLLTLVTASPDVLHDALIADKAVGKAAAACMVLGGVKQVWADVMSEPALALLQQYDIIAEYGTLVNHIINRTGDGWCPMEMVSRDLDDPATIIQKVTQKLQQMASSPSASR